MLVEGFTTACAEPARPIVVPQPMVDIPKTAAASNLQTAAFAGGCFWGVQGVFSHVKGVSEVVSGYAGGDKSTANYEMVSEGRTGHAESVRVQFNPKVVSYGELLRVYFSVAHDPTQLNRQENDIGTQYRSAVFAANAQQYEIARKYIEQLNAAKVFSKPIVTQVNTLQAFYPAESYHQDYLIRNPNNPYIVANDLPKINHLKTLFPTLYQENPVKTKSFNSTL